MIAPCIADYVRDLPPVLRSHSSRPPWDIAAETASILTELIGTLSTDFVVDGLQAVHRTADIHPSAVITGPLIVGAGARVGPHCRLREGAYVGPDAAIGPSSEVKSSWVMAGAALAHLNYVGNSLVGEDVNLEAGAVIANHFNERQNKQISVLFQGIALATGTTKFGAAIGWGSRIGANAVTTPGTLLPPSSIVNRLELINQLPGS